MTDESTRTLRTPRTLRVLVADDELLARKRLQRLLAAMESVVVVGECNSGDAVLERVKARDVDVLLLDVDMPGLSGLEVASLLPSDGPLVVLCTAHDGHAVDAFEHGAVDYILKPVEALRLKKALGRVREKLDARAPKVSDPTPTPTPATRDDAKLSRLALPTRAGIVLLDPRSVSHAVLDGELVTVFTEGASYLSDETLGDLHERLPTSLFERVHRRALLNLEHVTRLEPTETGGFVAHTRGGHAVDVSRQAARELRKRLNVK